jgi:hypothetical protein
MLNVYKNQQNRQTGSRNLMGPKTLPTIWDIWSQASYRYTILWVAFLDPSDSYFLFAALVGFYTHWTYMHIFRHIFLSNYWWQKTDIKTLPTIWGIYMKLVTKHQISAINSCWEKCDENCAGGIIGEQCSQFILFYPQLFFCLLLFSFLYKLVQTRTRLMILEIKLYGV